MIRLFKAGNFELINFLSSERKKNSTWEQNVSKFCSTWISEASNPQSFTSDCISTTNRRIEFIFNPVCNFKSSNFSSRSFLTFTKKPQQTRNDRHKNSSPCLLVLISDWNTSVETPTVPNSPPGKLLISKGQRSEDLNKNSTKTPGNKILQTESDCFSYRSREMTERLMFFVFLWFSETFVDLHREFEAAASWTDLQGAAVTPEPMLSVWMWAVIVAPELSSFNLRNQHWSAARRFVLRLCLLITSVIDHSPIYSWHKSWNPPSDISVSGLFQTFQTWKLKPVSNTFQDHKNLKPRPKISKTTAPPRVRRTFNSLLSIKKTNGWIFSQKSLGFLTGAVFLVKFNKISL